MANDFIHYIRRDVGVFNALTSTDKLWRTKGRPAMPAFEKPEYHITRSVEGPATEIKPGDTIWLIGQLFSPWGNLPPALDSRIEVANIIKLCDGKGYKFTAGEQSRWFPLADASHILFSDSMRTLSRDGKEHKLWVSSQQPIGFSLQRIRKLVSSHPLRQWEESVDSGGFDFISYRLSDGTYDAFQAVRSKIHNGESIFWDRWSLPRRLAEEGESVPDVKLEPYIRKQIKNAKTVWGISSVLYAGVNSYSALEKEFAESLDKFMKYPGKVSDS